MLGVRFEARIVYALHPRMLLEPVGDAAAIRIVLPHPHRERLGAARGEPAVERARNSAGGILNESDALGDVVAARDQHAADHVRMSIQVLRGRMEHDVGAELQGLLKDRCGKGVVDDKERFCFPCDFARRLEIAQSHHRIRRRLGIDDLGIRLDRGGDGIGIAAIDERERETETRPDMRHLPVRPAVHVLAADDMIARRQELHHRIERGEP